MRYGVLVLNTCLSEEKAERLSIVGYGVNPVGRPDETNKQTKGLIKHQTERIE